MNEIKVIKTEEDYREALKMIEAIMDADPDPDSDEGEKLAVLATLIEDYEAKTFPQTLPSPIEAIKFRMEQANLKSVDLIPYIGSRSRVSEVLSGKRKLTLDMMRRLETGLGISAKVLLRDASEVEGDPQYESWSNRLFSEMKDRGYFKSLATKAQSKDAILSNFFSPIMAPTQLAGMLRQSSYRSSPLTDKRALAAWSAYVLTQAKKIKVPKKYKNGTVNLELMQSVVKLSTDEKGPLLARDFLLKNGIILVIEKHLSKTHLDGAAILINKDNPVIGLTLRFDRLDNFWFTLMHELAHIALHYDNPEINLFFDEIEGVKVDLDKRESEADALAGEALVPESKWEVSPAKRIPSVMAAKSLARELGIHPAIVAGKMRYEGDKYVYMNKLIKESEVRKIFNLD